MRCDGCGEHPIIDIRYRCGNCDGNEEKHKPYHIRFWSLWKLRINKCSWSFPRIFENKISAFYSTRYWYIFSRPIIKEFFFRFLIWFPNLLWLLDLHWNIILTLKNRKPNQLRMKISVILFILQSHFTDSTPIPPEPVFPTEPIAMPAQNYSNSSH